MFDLDNILSELEYTDSRHYLTTVSDFQPETAHLFRTAKSIGVKGMYVIQTSPSNDQILAPQPTVYVSEVKSEEEAREVHKNLWNLCFVPFIIIKLPHQIRVYTGFNYSPQVEDDEEGLLDVIKPEDSLEKITKYLSAGAIDSGEVWRSKYAEKLASKHRVDEKLLTNLRDLGKYLKSGGLDVATANALIGKYVFLRYLRERDILSDKWLAQKEMNPEDIFTYRATRFTLEKLIHALRDFNGKIFPINFSNPKLTDEHISAVASVFHGDQLIQVGSETIRQLHLDFQAYNFRYIPVETLSAIYEQFLVDEEKDVRKKDGVVYTPEYLADYLLSEVASVKPLQRGMRILDPACGSGVFLVLAYRRLIESLGGKTTPEQLRDILLESIYGVERKRDACYVAEFSLILTLLHYSEPSQLQQLKFKLPDLHNTRIFESDFFDLLGEDCEATIWEQDIKFDWIVGNPPWTEIKPKSKGEKHVKKWLEAKSNKELRPVGGRRVAEAFSWLVTDLVSEGGTVGLLLPATSLVNLESEQYRKQFFTTYTVNRITNFANFRTILFGKRNSSIPPAATVIYGVKDSDLPTSSIIHYAPFVATQQSTTRDKPWFLTINENEIQFISSDEAKLGETLTWKTAIWGTPRDKLAIRDFKKMCVQQTLENFCEEIGWGVKFPSQGIELRNEPNDQTNEDELIYCEDVVDLQVFDTRKHNVKPTYRFSLKDDSLKPNKKHYLRVRGGKSGLRINHAPHILISKAWQNFTLFSDRDFIVPPQQMGISAPDTKYNRELLRALTVYLSSNLVGYFVFFNVPEWGIFRQRKSVVTTIIRQIPTPYFTEQQVKVLAALHHRIQASEKEKQEVFIINLLQSRQNSLIDDKVKSLEFTSREKRLLKEFTENLDAQLQAEIDQVVFEALNVPDELRLLVEDFVEFRLPLDTLSQITKLDRPTDEHQLLLYAQSLQKTLDEHTTHGIAYHAVSIFYSDSLIECVVEIGDEPVKITQENIEQSSISRDTLFAELSESLREQVSQWVYVQRGLRFFDDDNDRVYLYKSPRCIEWTRTQAINDAWEIIRASLT